MANIYFVLDQSGSMYSCLDDTLGGFNLFIDNQKKDNVDGKMSLYLFSNEVNTAYENKNMIDVPNLDRYNYIPSGGTALLDAIGNTIKIAEKDNNNKTIVVILTDGFENMSHKYTKFHINDIINMKKKEDWKFVFLAANQDAIQTGNDLGIDKRSAMTFNPNCIQETFEGLSAAVTRCVSGEETNIEFTGLERAASQLPDDDIQFTGIGRSNAVDTPITPQIMMNY